MEARRKMILHHPSQVGTVLLIRFVLNSFSIRGEKDLTYDDNDDDDEADDKDDSNENDGYDKEDENNDIKDKDLVENVCCSGCNVQKAWENKSPLLYFCCFAVRYMLPLRMGQIDSQL